MVGAGGFAHHVLCRSDFPIRWCNCGSGRLAQTSPDRIHRCCPCWDSSPVDRRARYGPLWFCPERTRRNRIRRGHCLLQRLSPRPHTPGSAGTSLGALVSPGLSGSGCGALCCASIGFAVGYAGSFVGLFAALPLVSASHFGAAFILVAVLFAAFSLPAFLWLPPDRITTHSVGTAARAGWQGTWQTARGNIRMKPLPRVLP